MNRMKMPALVITLVSILIGNAGAFDSLVWPDGRKVKVVQGNRQIDLSDLRSGIEGKATDRRFVTRNAMYLANEIYLSGTEFFLRASETDLPIANDPELSYIANVEAYWYSRYNLMSLTSRSRAGIGVIHGPYVDLLAQESSRLNRFGPYRGELEFSNKDIMLSKVVAAYLKRTGMPQKFENAVPLMLEFKSAAPFLVEDAAVEKDTTGRARYQNDYDGLRWRQDDMDIAIDMGGVAQSLLKKVLWAKFFLRRNHGDDDFPGEVFLGNNAEDGLRGAMLTLEAVSTMLMTKAALFVKKNESPSLLAFGTDHYLLTGINPTTYHPEQGLRHIPHEIEPTLVYMGDMPVRHYDLKVKDASSSLWDTASWLWATTEFFDYANPRKKDNWDNVFGFQSPYDGSVMEQKYSLLAQGLANAMLANIRAMHTRDGLLVSDWSPNDGAGRRISVSDLAMAMVALENYARVMDLDPDNTATALALLRKGADFLVKVATGDGSYRESYAAATGTPAGERTMTVQAFAIRALMAAYRATAEERYLQAARRTSRTWNVDFWDEGAGLFKNTPDAAKVVYTPVDVGAALAALREMILADRDAALLKRFKRFFVQSIDASGLQQAETTYTGEILSEVRNGVTDSDGDGIPFLGRDKAGARVDSVFAARVEFDLSGFSAGPRPTPLAAPALQNGQRLFAANCEICHGEKGIGNEGPRLVENPLVQLTGRDAVIGTVSRGRVSVGMPAWGNSLSNAEIGKIVDYVRNLKVSAGPDLRGAFVLPVMSARCRRVE